MTAAQSTAADVAPRALAVATQVAARWADDVDRNARFPVEAIAEIRSEHLLSAAVPVELGGLGLGVVALVEVAEALAEGCASTSMIWAMHQIQLACIARHGQDSPHLMRLLRQIAEGQLLVASVTSEKGVGGDIRTSFAPIDDDASCRKRLRKHGSTISYGAQADAFLVTARRHPEALSHDQVLALVLRADAALEPAGDWDTLGMRGTAHRS